MSEAIEHTVSCGNVFADLGFPDAEERLLKADLGIQLGWLIKIKKMTRAQAAAQMGLDKGEIVLWQRGEMSELSIERLFQCLNRLGHSIEVRILPEEVRPEDTRLTLVMV